jgi:hypothetical protein
VLRSGQALPNALADARSQGKDAQQATWDFFDLWEKDAHGTWGATSQTVRGALADVDVRSHAVRVWRVVRAQTPAMARLVLQEL